MKLLTCAKLNCLKWNYFLYAKLEIEMFLTIKLCIYAKLNCLKIESFICIKMDLALNYLQSLICHKTQINKQTKNLCIQRISKYLVKNDKELCIEKMWPCPKRKVGKEKSWKGIELPDQESIRTLGEKEKLHILGNLECGFFQRDERKNE